MQQTQNDSVFDSLYESIKDDLSVYSCNLITNLKAAANEIQSETRKRDDYNKYEISFIDKKIDMLSKKIKLYSHNNLNPMLDKIINEKQKIESKLNNVGILDNEDVDLINYYLVYLSACLNLDLNLEKYSSSTILYVFKDVYEKIISGNFIDEFKAVKTKG